MPVCQLGFKCLTGLMVLMLVILRKTNASNGFVLIIFLIIGIQAEKLVLKYV